MNEALTVTATPASVSTGRRLADKAASRVHAAPPPGPSRVVHDRQALADFLRSLAAYSTLGVSFELRAWAADIDGRRP